MPTRLRVVLRNCRMTDRIQLIEIRTPPACTGRPRPWGAGLLWQDGSPRGQNQCTVNAADVNCIGRELLITGTTVYRLRLPNCSCLIPRDTPFRPIKFVINWQNVAFMTTLASLSEKIVQIFVAFDLFYTVPFKTQIMDVYSHQF